MTDIGQKGQALLAEIRDEASKLIGFNGPTYQHLTRWADCVETLCRAIEQHEAFKREVSDVCSDVRLNDGLHKLDRFIIAKPDPLVEVLEDIESRKLGYLGETCAQAADTIRAAIEKRGGKIVWGEG